MSAAEVRRVPLLYLLVLLSGASGLVFEIVWIRALGRHFGTTAPAVTTVLAAFMGGLALGNVLIGRRADRSARPLALYRWLEIGIAASGLGVSLVLLRADPVLDALARATAAAGGASVLVRFAVFGLLMLVPTTLMGGTLPVLARALVSSGASGRVVGALYAVNTAGAVLGVLAPDFLLVPAVGLTLTACVAAAGNAMAAAGVGLVGGGTFPVERETPPAGPVPRRAAALFAVSGFCAMGVEVLWSRLLENWTASVVTSFAILLAVFLLFLALGSALTSRLADRVASPLSWAAACLAATGPAVVLPLAFVFDWRAFELELVPPAGGLVQRAGLAQNSLDALLHALYLEGAACLVMGAAFPFFAAAAVRAGAAGRETGRLVALNTLAGVVGSAVAGFVLLPHLGVQMGALVLASLASAIACAVGFTTGRVGRAPALVTAVALAVVLGCALLLPRDHVRRSYFAGKSGELLSIREGPTTTAAVALQRWYGQPAYLELKTPGISMSDTRFGSQRYMGLMGHLGAFLAREPRAALLICYGVGNTARSLLAHPDLERLDVVDIASEVIASSPSFAGVHGGDPLRDPRVEVFVDDGRAHLVTRERSYDVITSEPPPPVNAGVANLYSREYYALARGRLAPGGVLTQWLPIFQLSEDETASIVAAFAAELPHTALFYGYWYQWILVGSDAPLAIDPAAWERRAALPGVAADLERIGVEGAGDLIASFLRTDAGLRAAVADARPVTDDRPSIQYPRERLGLPPAVPAGLVGDPADVRELLAPGAQRDALERLAPFLSTTRRVLEALPHSGTRPQELDELLYDARVQRALAGRGAHTATLALSNVGDDRATLARAALEAGSQDLEARLTVLLRAYLEGDWADAQARLEAFEAFRQGAPARWWLLLGGCRRGVGDAEQAAEAFRRAAAASRSDEFKRRALELAARAGEPLGPDGVPLWLDGEPP